MCKKYVVYTTTQLSMQMQNMYYKLNDRCFGGTLPRTIITYEAGKKQGAYGWTFNRKMWNQNGEHKYSIVIAAEFLDNLTNIIITLIHEMCRIYAMENGIQDTSNRGYYHNNEFKKIAENAGLVCTKERQGWATRSMSPELEKWVEDNCPIREIKLKLEPEGVQPKKPEPKDESGEGESEPEDEQTPKKKSGYYVYCCPECKAKARATKIQLIACMGTPEEKHMPQMMQIEN